MGVQIPHLAAPFTLTRRGAKTVEQGSTDEIAGCVYNICVCPEAFREDLPAYGVPDIQFGVLPLDAPGMRSAIERWEPRADLSVAEYAQTAEEALRVLSVEVGVRE